MRSRLGTRLSVIVLLLAGLVLHLSAGSGSEECTTLVATGAATRGGGPLLWKNRDTGTLSNKVILVPEHPYSFLALVDADDTAGRIERSLLAGRVAEHLLEPPVAALDDALAHEGHADRQHGLCAGSRRPNFTA